MTWHAVTQPPPIEGLRLDIDRSETTPRQALKLLNWRPRDGALELRPGTIPHGWIGPNDEDLVAAIPFESGEISRLLVVDRDGQVMDYTDGGEYDVDADSTLAVFTLPQTGDALERLHVSSSFLASGYRQFWFCRGMTPQVFDYTEDEFNGSDFDVTGAGTLTNLDWSHWHGGRIWFGDSRERVAYYLEPGYLSGAVHQLSLAGIGSRGGGIVSAGTWARDWGSGPDAALFFITSGGELFLYQGQPGTTLRLAAQFWIGEPAGHDCWVSHSGDVLIATSEGLVSMQGLFAEDRGARPHLVGHGGYERYRELWEARESDASWSLLSIPRLQAFLLTCAPANSQMYYSYETGNVVAAEWDLETWRCCEWAGETYAVANTQISRLTGYFDQLRVGEAYVDNPIRAVARAGWERMGTQLQKRLLRLRHRLQVGDGDGVDVRTAIAKDYSEVHYADSIIQYVEVQGPQFDIAHFDIARFSEPLETQTRQGSLRGQADTVSIQVTAQGKSRLRWLDSTIEYMPSRRRL